MVPFPMKLKVRNSIMRTKRNMQNGTAALVLQSIGTEKQ